MDALIWNGLTRAEAAKRANMSEHSLYAALRKPHVKAYYLQQLEVLRLSERARNIHTLVSVRDQESNQMARVQAVKELEQLSDDDPRGPSSATHSPGLTIRIINQVQAQQPSGPVIDVSATDVTRD